MDLATIGLKADSSSIVKGSKDLDKLTESSKKADVANDNFAASSKKAESASDRLNKSFRGAGAGATFLKATVVSLAAGLGLSFLQKATDGYTEFGNKLRVAGVDAAAFEGVQNRLFDAANQNGQAIGSVATLYQKASQAGRDLGASQSQLLDFVDGVTAALKVNGGSAESASGALMQLGQALGGGTVRAEEFNSILEGAPTIAKAAAEGLYGVGASVSRLRNDVISGNISSKQFFDAFLKGAQDMKMQAGELDMTIGAAFVTLSNGALRFIGTLDQTVGASSMVAQAISAIGLGLNYLAQNIGPIASALLPLAPLMAAVFGPIVLGWVLTLTAAIVGPLIGATAAFFLMLAANPLTAFIGAIVLILGFFVDWEKSINNLIELWGIFMYEVKTFLGDTEGAAMSFKLAVDAKQAVADLGVAGSEFQSKALAAFEAGGNQAAPKLANGVSTGGDAAAAKIAGAMTMTAAKAEAIWESLNGKVIEPLGQKLLDGGEYFYNQATGAIEKAGGTAAATMDEKVTSAGEKAGQSMASGIGSAASAFTSTFVGQIKAAQGTFLSMGASLADLLIARFRTETNVLRAQAAAALADAELKSQQARAIGEGRGQDGTGRGGSGGGGASRRMFSGSTGGNGGTLGDRIDRPSTLAHNSVAPWEEDQYAAWRRQQGYAPQLPSQVREQVSYRPTPAPNADSPNMPSPTQQVAPQVNLQIVNKLSPDEVLTALQTAQGAQLIQNIIANDRDVYQQMLGV
jgi:tape measure domain-containing protein